MSSSKAINRDEVHGKSPRGSSALDRLSNTQSSHGSDVKIAKKKIIYIQIFLFKKLSSPFLLKKNFLITNSPFQLNRKSVSGLTIPTGNFFRKLADGSWVIFNLSIL